MKVVAFSGMKYRSRVFMLALFIGVFFLTAPVFAEELKFSEKILLDKQPDTFSLVRHIKLCGTQRQIGRKLAEIAKERYGVTLGECPLEAGKRKPIDFI